MEIDVPTSVAYNCYLDREAIPRWMPFISTVKVCFQYPICATKCMSVNRLLILAVSTFVSVYLSIEVS